MVTSVKVSRLQIRWETIRLTTRRLAADNFRRWELRRWRVDPARQATARRCQRVLALPARKRPCAGIAWSMALSARMPELSAFEVLLAIARTGSLAARRDAKSRH